MYKFVFEKERKDTELILIQAILVIAAVAAFIYRYNNYQALGYISSALLLITAFFVRLIIIGKGVNKWMVLAVGAALLFAATFRVLFPLIMFFYGALIQLIVKAPELWVDEKGVTSRTLFGQKKTPWEDFNSVLIKDGLLVLDYRDNRVKYLPVNQDVNEGEFNNYCKVFTAS